ncbi:hypothetical protein FNV43_RR14511 [Rhamnella rubrinervis]|uniref:Glycosyltransferase n=1 Tax=Rhamnella rubrinervis TaxID=2594499 RepID=A0A8K0MGH7_9ROSA|nr:hypothetical protein FNV43_RR14511 [Rhamnella rubrinervis]
MSDSSDLKSRPHVALLSSAGMGHLTPFIRLAASLTAHNVQVTFITPHPTVTLAESESLSHFFSTFTQITRKHFHLLPLDDPSANSEDPSYYHFEVIRRSSHLLRPILSPLSPPLSALITDMSLASTVIGITDALRLPNYILFTSSAKVSILFLYFHSIVSTKTTENGKKMTESSGILINTYESIEQESLAVLSNGQLLEKLPPVFAIGPLPPCNFEKSQPLAWLDDQPAKSVLYISFGGRTATSREQMRELGDGLGRSGNRFLWVVKDKKVYVEDDSELVEVLGHGLMERMKGRGLVVKNWFNQEEVLSHQAIGGFLSHCGWNSVNEAIWHGVPMLSWPQHGDQKINADLVERIGLGMWVESWGWGGDGVVVKGEEIAERVEELMGNELLRLRAASVREEARRAVGDGGSSHKTLTDLIETWKTFLVL